MAQYMKMKEIRGESADAEPAPLPTFVFDDAADPFDTDDAAGFVLVNGAPAEKEIDKATPKLMAAPEEDEDGDGEAAAAVPAFLDDRASGGPAADGGASPDDLLDFTLFEETTHEHQHKKWLDIESVSDSAAGTREAAPDPDAAWDAWDLFASDPLPSVPPSDDGFWF